MPSRQEIVNAVAEQVGKQSFTNQAARILMLSTDKVLDRMKQNLDAQMTEDTYPVVEEFARKLGSKLMGLAQGWGRANQNREIKDSLIFPEGTRYIHRDGDVINIVVEQPPALRTIHIQKGYYRLSFPYIQFVFGIKNDKIISFRVSMTKKPIANLDEMVYHLNLPNSEDHKICMYYGGDYIFPRTGSMNDRVKKVIGDFWQSEFTCDQYHNHEVFLAKNFPSEPLITDRLKQWSASASSNLLSVLDFAYTPGQTIRSFFLEDVTAAGSVAFVNNVKTEIINAVGGIGGEIQSLLANNDLKSENLEKVHLKLLEGVLKEIIVQAYSELWEYVDKQLKEERGRLQKEMEVAAKKLREEFKNYMNVQAVKSTKSIKKR